MYKHLKYCCALGACTFAAVDVIGRFNLDLSLQISDSIHVTKLPKCLDWIYASSSWMPWAIAQLSQQTTSPLLPQSLSYVAWPVYWFAQGSILMGFWVLGHECGHHAFSEYQWIDDAVGFFIHSVTLTPYFSFKYSHRSHHAHTNSIEYDEVYIPKRKSDTLFSEFLNNGPGNVFTLVLRITMGLPLYLIFNVYGRDYEGFANHFLPQSGIFNKSERVQVVLSDVGIMAVLYAFYHLFVTQGVKSTLFLYGIPLLVMSGFFVFLTYLNHTHPSIAHYDSTEWDWLRGALSTIDRDFGILNGVFHNANQTHVVHHLFPTIPHYHAIEAREAVKPMLGDYYKYDDTPVLKAMWRDTKECIYVEPDESTEKKGVYWLSIPAHQRRDFWYPQPPLRPFPLPVKSVACCLNVEYHHIAAIGDVRKPEEPPRPFSHCFGEAITIWSLLLSHRSPTTANNIDGDEVEGARTSLLLLHLFASHFVLSSATTSHRRLSGCSFMLSTSVFSRHQPEIKRKTHHGVQPWWLKPRNRFLPPQATVRWWPWELIVG
ncbi:unnamed protein product [Lactuca saligna]|uniref:Fatty acid desaturase domain-containing protein n=1 Tax=Lactuca saligna TaxID=75948 RepID=A0AA36E002_LACSI|nr:unnamed protein product [Lactuca saligna]